MILFYLQPTVILIVTPGISRLLDYWFITNKEVKLVFFISGAYLIFVTDARMVSV